MDNRQKFLYCCTSRTVGTQKESEPGMERPVQANYQSVGKTAGQWEDVMRSEEKVAKRVSWLPKAAIDCTVPVP